MRNTPLLPRSWLSPLGGVGARHSMWSCTSPNACLVAIEPVPATTSMCPSATSQRAGRFALSADRQAWSDLPSNNTIASEGGGAEALNGPGSTTGGCGRSIECCGHLVDTCAPADIAIIESRTAARVGTGDRALLVAQRGDVRGDRFHLIVGQWRLSAALGPHREPMRLVLDRVGGHAGHDQSDEVLVRAVHVHEGRSHEARTILRALGVRAVAAHA